MKTRGITMAREEAEKSMIVESKDVDHERQEKAGNAELLADVLSQLSEELTLVTGLISYVESLLPLEVEEREIFAQTNVTLNSLIRTAKRLRKERLR